jgi:hypothetical protein
MTNRAQFLRAKEVEQEEGTKNLERFEELLLNFQETEVPIEPHVPPTLRDSVLFLMAQHRRFRLYKPSIFCPEEEFLSKKLIKAFGALAIHLQRDHGISKTKYRRHDSTLSFDTAANSDQNRNHNKTKSLSKRKMRFVEISLSWIRSSQRKKWFS